MEGKFRKRSEAVWCPKPSTKLDMDKIRKQRSQGQLDLTNLPRKPKKVTGWQNWSYCDGCPFLEEFDLDNNGVFCLYPKRRDEV